MSEGKFDVSVSKFSKIISPPPSPASVSFLLSLLHLLFFHGLISLLYKDVSNMAMKKKILEEQRAARVP